MRPIKIGKSLRKFEELTMILQCETYENRFFLIRFWILNVIWSTMPRVFDYQVALYICIVNFLLVKVFNILIFVIIFYYNILCNYLVPCDRIFCTRIKKKHNTCILLSERLDFFGEKEGLLKYCWDWQSSSD